MERAELLSVTDELSYEAFDFAQKIDAVGRKLEANHAEVRELFREVADFVYDAQNLLGSADRWVTDDGS